MLLHNQRYAGRFLSVFFSCCLAGSLCLGAEVGDVDQADLARRIPAEAGVKGGLIVHVGCGDGKLTAALRANESYQVHGLDVDAANVERARKHIRSLGDYGEVSVDTFDGKRLPYIANLVNLVVASGEWQVPREEVLRVLAPGGVAISLQPTAFGLQPFKKPWPAEIDEWTHFLHGPDNNAVAHDDVVGPPRRMQWVGGPRYSRHHDRMSSVSAVVTSGGRVFYIMDEAPDVSILTAPKWNLIARDAFNGTILWRRPMGQWFNHMHGLKSGPADLPRRLVAVGDRVYLTLGIGEPLAALDAATGETVHTYAETEDAEELICSEGILFVQVGTATTEAPARKPKPRRRAASTKSLMAIQADSGNAIWTAEHAMLKGTLAVRGRRVVFMSGDRIICLDRSNGKNLWRSEPLPRAENYPNRFTPTLVLCDDVVLFAGGEFAANGNRSWATEKNDTLTALSAETGKILWTAPHPLSGYASSEDLLVVDGVVWCGETTSGHAVGRFTGRDVKTGKVVAEFDPDVETYWFHHRCYRGKATDKYLLMSRTGTEFIDIDKQSWSINHWVRGACLYGVMPANGLLYAPQHPCACYLEAKMYGFNALAAGGRPKTEDRRTKEARLEKGAAFDESACSDLQPTAFSLQPSADWPMYRHDVARSGHASTEVPKKLRQTWAADIGGRLTSPVVADGFVFLASIDTHTVHALDATSGKELWQYTAGGRVDSPPTYWKGCILFGSADGCVYCLRASDGAITWRFRAAPIDQRLMAFEQLESVWPVHGSVLIHDNVLYFVAGRSMFLDGGLRLYRLDPKSGRVLSETVMDETDPGEGKKLEDYARQQNMPVAFPDVLSTDGRLVYMRSQPFELDGTRLPLEALPYAGNPERYSVPPTQRQDHAHLFSPTGFLDDTWWHRTYWIYGSRFLGGWAGYSQAGKVAPGGKILVFDEDKVYGFGRKPKFYRWTTPIEHQLFRAAKDPSAVEQQGRKPGGRVQHDWTLDVPLFARAMLLAHGTLFFAGPKDLVDEEQAVKRMADPQVQERLREQEEAFAGKSGGTLWAVSAESGEKLSGFELDTIPVFDGMAAARGRLYLSGVNGQLMCFGGER